MPTPIKVLVVDDSLFMRAAIKKLLDSQPDFQVLDTAKNGREAVEKVISLRPDVVTMDFNMPEMNGAEAVLAIMKVAPTPVLMFSAHTRQGAKETFEALDAGAVDFVSKPSGEVSAQLDTIAQELCHKLRNASRSRPKLHAPITIQPSTKRPSLRVSRTMMAVSDTGPRVVVIAISTGGPVALSRFIPQLPASLRVAVIVVQHMPSAFTALLAERLNGESKVPVREAKEGDVPTAGTVLIAPGDKHLMLDALGTIRLNSGPPVHGCRPAADITMKSAAAALGRRAVGIVMTGMGKDGAQGLLAIKNAMGKTFAQDKASSVIYGMPKAALDLGAVDEIIPLDEIPNTLQLL